MTRPETAAPAGGRPRDPAADDAILGATLAILSDDGYAGLTIERVAHRAGVGKSTIYRRWGSKDDVLVAAVDRLASEVPVPDTGDLRADLTSIARGLATVFSSPGIPRLVGNLLAQMTVAPQLADALRGGFLAARRAAARDVLDRERARGGVRSDLDVEVAVDLLAAPLYYRLLVTGAAIDDAFVDRVVEAVVRFAR